VRDELAWFDGMIPRCLEHAEQAARQSRPIVGICCEYTPREIMLAAGAVPVCLCGGSAETIESAEADLPANLCPLIKSTYGYHVERSNPFLELADLIVAETTCDGKKKMYELLAQSRDVFVLDLPQQPELDGARAYWRGQLQRLVDFCRQRWSVEIRDEDLRSAIRQMNQERQLRRGLAELLARPEPPLTGLELLKLKSSISCIPADLEAYRTALSALSSQARPELADRVRVLLTGVPVVHGAERVIEILESSGGLVVAQENCTGLKPILEDVDEDAADPLDALAAKYLHLPCSVMSPNEGRLDSIRHLGRDYRAEAVVDLSWQACLTYDVESARVRRLARQLDLGYLRISTDYSPCDSARIATRVEALYETVRSRRRAP
jgi:benzoyl-CoA reductase/2-hydroxyglutaryl-CoA dehydratase subunit BcrC/BadD/HgdB